MMQQQAHASYAAPEQSHSAAQALFSAENVTVRYGNQLALDDVTLTLTRGAQIAVVGPNGAGKSTLFKLIVGDVEPTTGRVALFGDMPHEHICVAYVPQRQTIDWSFPVSVADVVMMGRVGRIGLLRWPSRHDRNIVRQSLERVDGLELANKQIGELSGGQQQRVFIARALAQEPHLLLLDEPLAGLDGPSQTQFMTLLDDVRRDGLTTLVATHDLNMAANRFDEVILLNKRLIAAGSAETIFSAENLATAYGSHLHSRNGIVIADTHCDH